jgi:hypothetical protein
MTNILINIALAFLFSASALSVVLLRVSPLSSVQFAIPFLFICLFATITTFFAFLLLLAKDLFTDQPLRSRQHVSSSLRQGMFIAAGTCFIIFLHLLHILNWWIALLIYLVFLLVEMAMSR